MSKIDEMLTVVGINHANTTGGRIIESLHRSGSSDRQELSRLLLSSIMQDVDPEFRSYLSGEAADEGEAPPPPAPEETRPQYTRPNGEVYYARKWDASWDVDVLKTARTEKMSALLVGPPGTGKTAMAEAAFDGELITFVISGDTTTSELIGSFIPDGTDGYKWIDGPLLIAVREGRPILLDEILLADPKVLSVIYPLMDGRGFLGVSENPAIGTVMAKEGFYIIGAGNPNVPGARMSEALVSRFPLQVEVTTDFELAKTLGVRPKLITFASNLYLRQTAVNQTISWSPQFRELMDFMKVERVFGYPFAVKNLYRICPPHDRDEFRLVADQLDLLPGGLKAAKI